MKNVFIIFAIFLAGFFHAYGQKSIYAVDTVESQILWYCGNHYGCMNLESGYISIVKGEISSGSFMIDMNSIDDDDITDNELLRKTLSNIIKSDQFFNAEEFPSSIFTLLSVERIDSVNNHILGILKIKDRANNIDFDGEISIFEDRLIGYSDIINIDRTEWGINSLSKKYDPEGKNSMVVPDTISIVIYLYADKIKKNKK